MTNRLEEKLRALRASGGRGLAPYVTAGDGGLATTLHVLRALDRAGVTCIELGVPFSDPIADGPVLQAANQRALDAGTTLDGILDMLATFRSGSDGSPACEVPVVIMSYANPILRRGYGAACARIRAAGGDGLLLADVPVEEGDEVARAAADAELCPIFFVSPTTSDERARRAARASRGFLYAIGRFGVTGASSTLDEKAQRFLERVRGFAEEADVALAVGFGIGTPEGVRAATRHADLAIVGSAFVDHVHRAATDARVPAAAAFEAATSFTEDLLRGLPA